MKTLAVKMGRRNRSNNYHGSTEARIETFCQKSVIDYQLI